MYRPSRWCQKEKLAAAGSVAAQSNTNVPKDTMQGQLTAVHPSPLQHRLLWASQGSLSYSGKLLHFDSRTQPVYIYPAGKEVFPGQGNNYTTNHALSRKVPISSPCIHVQKANKCQHLKERMKWCFCRGLGMMTKQSKRLPLEIVAHAQDHSTEASTYSSFITWASMEILVLSITAP